jgi:hypothetical protein
MEMFNSSSESGIVLVEKGRNMNIQRSTAAGVEVKDVRSFAGRTVALDEAIVGRKAREQANGSKSVVRRARFSNPSHRHDTVHSPS